VTLVQRWRLSDAYNGPSLSDPATSEDVDFAVGVECAGTPDPAQGSSCQVSTTANALTPGEIKEGKAMVIQGFRARVNDSGPNAIPGDADDRAFAQQGIYVP
jgi:hypothetical protein